MVKGFNTQYSLTEMAWCFGLHEYNNKILNYKKVIDDFLDVFRSFGLEVSAAAASVPDLNSEKAMTLKGTLRRLEKRDFKNFHDVSFFATHESGVTAGSLEYLDFDGPLDDPPLIRKDLTFEIDKQFVDGHFDRFYTGIQVFIKTLSPEYGYALMRPFKLQPLWYIKASCHCKDAFESEMIQKWRIKYRRSDGTYKPGDFRDIYPINVLSQPHMDHIIDSKPFQDWVEAASYRGRIESVTKTNWIWHVEEEHISQVREDLRPTGLVLCI